MVAPYVNSVLPNAKLTPPADQVSVWELYDYMPHDLQFNSTGRAYPDVSAIGLTHDFAFHLSTHCFTPLPPAAPNRAQLHVHVPGDDKQIA